MDNRVIAKINEKINMGWLLVDAVPLDSQTGLPNPKAETVKAFKRQVIVSLENACNIDDATRYIEIVKPDPAQETLPFKRDDN